MISVGQKIDTHFSLEIYHNGEIKTVTFADLLDKPMIVSVYMKNNTGSCDNQNKSLAEYAEAIAAKGYHLIAVSKDGCKSHQKYAEKMGISYILGSDPDTLISKVTDSIVQKSMYGKTYEGPARSAFVIDTDGTVKAVIESVDTKRHGEELLALINRLS
jgi:peroxiredoxin Q/BCP